MQFAAAPLNEIQAANVADFLRAKETAGKDEAGSASARGSIAADSYDRSIRRALQREPIHRMLNLRDEGTGFINGMGRYNGAQRRRARRLVQRVELLIRTRSTG